MPTQANQQDLAKPWLSVIIPCRNEAQSLPRLLSQLSTQADIRLEIIVADGNSDDGTLALAKAAGAKTCQSAPNRGAQMNTAAQLASADWLLFLHADSQLSDPQQLAAALRLMQQQADNDICAGHFPLQFIDRPERQKRWRVLAYKTTLNLPLTISGDQGCLIRREHFQALGGFQTSLPFLEDQIFAAAVHRQGRWLSLPQPLLTSARRFQQQGFAGRYLLMTLIMVAHHCGLPEFLDPAALYPEQRHAKRVDLSAHLRQLLRRLLQLPKKRQLSFCWRLAALARDNSYQLALWLDAGLGLRRWPITRLWLNSGQRLSQMPLFKTLWQLLLLPVFPLLAILWLLLTTIGARIKPQAE